MDQTKTHSANESGVAMDVLIVDDEPLARKGLRALLRDLPGVQSIREAVNGNDAIRLIGERRPDIVFLDVRMPGIDGFGVIERVGADNMPPVIFITAYDAHALKAFEVHAVDYLLKPVDPARFRDAFERACHVANHGTLSTIRAALAALLPLLRQTPGVPANASEAATAANEAPRLRIRHEGKIVLIDPMEINWVDSVGNYVRLHLRGGTLRHRATMDDMQAQLGTRFVRIRRSTLVRASAVRYCEPLGKGSYHVVLHDKTRLASSRYFRNELSVLLDD